MTFCNYYVTLMPVALTTYFTNVKACFFVDYLLNPWRERIRTNINYSSGTEICTWTALDNNASTASAGVKTMPYLSDFYINNMELP